MKSWQKKIIFILLTFIMLGTIVYFYVNRILLPVQVKHKIEDQITAYTNRPTSIEKIHFKLTKGITLENVLIRETGENRTFLQIDEIHFNLLLAPFFKSKTIVIPTVTIRKPKIQVIQYADGTFNFSDIQQNKEGNDASPPYRVYVTKIQVIDGSVDYLKKSIGSDFSEIFRNVQVVLMLSIDKQVSGQLSASIPLEDSQLKLNGLHTLGTKDWIASLNATNINLLKYVSQLDQPKTFRLDKGMISSADIRVKRSNKNLLLQGDAYFVDTNLHLKHDRQLTGNIRLLNTSINVHDSTVKANGEIRLPSMWIQLAPGNQFEGDLQSNISSLVYNQNNFALNGNIKINNVLLALDGQKKMSGQIVSRNMAVNYADNKFSLHGDFDLDDLNLNLTEAEQYKGKLTTKNTSVNYSHNKLIVKSSVVADENQMTYAGHQLLNSKITTNDFELKYHDQLMTITCPLQFSDVVLTFKQGSKFQGTPNLDLNITHSKHNPKLNQFTGILSLENGLLLGLPIIESAANMNGNIKISNHLVETDRLTANIENTNFSLSGQVKNFDDYVANVNISSEDLELRRLTRFFPKLFADKQIALEGRTAIEMDFTGKPTDLEDADIKVVAKLKDAILSSDHMSDQIHHIKGTIEYSADHLDWTNLYAIYKNFPFRLNGQLNNFSKPIIETTLSGKNLEINSKIRLFYNSIRFPSLDIHYLDSWFNGNADLYILENSAPDIQVKGKGQVNLKNIASAFGQMDDLKKKISLLELSGMMDTDLFFKGKLKDWRDWSLTVNGTSDQMTIKQHPLSDVKLTYLQRDKNISKLNLSSDIYEGKLNFVSSANIENDIYPFKMAIDLYDMNLASLVKTQQLKKNKLAGDLSLSVDLFGQVFDQKTWEGKGNYDLSDGYIWRMKIIEGISKALLIKEFIHTVYTSSNADFKIKDRRINTNNLYIASQTVKLTGKGWIDFDQQINFEVIPVLSQIAMIQSESIKKITTALLAQNIRLIEVTGSVKNPKVNPKASPAKILKNTTGVITEGIGGIVDGIFNP